jgi:ATP-binding cassette subfamily C protein
MSAASPHPRGGARAFARALWRRDPRGLVLAVLLSLGVSAFEAGGVLALIPLLESVGLAPPTGGGGRTSALVRQAFLWVGVRPTLVTALVAFVAILTLQAVLQREQTRMAWQVEMGLRLSLRQRLYAAMARARWLYFTRIRSSDLLQSLTFEIDRCGAAAGQLLSLITFVLVSCVYLLLALRISAAACVVAALCGGMLLLVSRGFARRVRAAGQSLSRVNREMSAAASEQLQSMKVVKSYGVEDRNIAIFAAAAEHTQAAHVRAARIYADSRAFFTIGSVLLLAVVVWVSVDVLRLQPTVTLLLAFIFFRLVPRLQNLQTSYQQLVHELPAYEQVMERLEALEEARERLGPPTTAVHRLSEGIRLEQFSFRYPTGARDALSAVSLSVQARRTTAVVGASGSGKSTLADLVMGLVRPDSGRVMVDERELDESWLRGWREGIGYVAQDTVLFHTSVRENLRWASPDASDEVLWEALRASASEGFVAALPEGLDTVIGERGVRLSGGERQRLALARALLRQPALLILDEATSALDTENERRIRDAIVALHGRVTILLITHRLSSVRDADVIHVVEGGQLIESGDWQSLVSRPGGRFRALWRSQQSEAAEVAESSSDLPTPAPTG